MIALSKETFDTIKKEARYIGLLFLSVFIIFKIMFFNESLLVLFRMNLSLFWLFVLPGYFAMLCWKENLDFPERLAAGIALSAAVIGISSYYIGLMGLNIKYHAVLLPAIIMILGITGNVFRKEQSVHK